MKPYIKSTKAGVALEVLRIDPAYPNLEWMKENVYIRAEFKHLPDASIPSVTMLRENDWVLYNWYPQTKKLKFISVKTEGVLWRYDFMFVVGYHTDAKERNPAPEPRITHLRKFRNLIVDDA